MGAPQGMAPQMMSAPQGMAPQMIGAPQGMAPQGMAPQMMGAQMMGAPQQPMIQPGNRVVMGQAPPVMNAQQASQASIEYPNSYT